MKRFILGFVLTVFFLGGFVGFADNPEFLTFTATLPEYFSADIELGVSSVALTVPMPPVEDADTWATPFTMDVDINTSGELTRLYVSSSDLSDGEKTIPAQQVRFRASGDFVISERGLSNTPAMIGNFDGFAGSYSASAELGFRSYITDTPGIYVATVTFSILDH